MDINNRLQFFLFAFCGFISYLAAQNCKLGETAMKILLIGSGGREHALALKLKESKKVTQLYALPGNPGICQIARRIELPVDDFEAIADFCQADNIDLVVVGPEEPLINGMADFLIKEGIAVFGPRKQAAALEGSKAFSKDLMRKYNIPTAAYQTFSSSRDAIDYLKDCSYPIVVKASGIAAGKGVIIAQTQQEAVQAVQDMMENRIFGAAGAEVVIEEFMIGEEASVFAVTDGNYYQLLTPAQDHKAVFDGDLGPNTGGMGTYAPAPVVCPSMLEKIGTEIVEPTLRAMREEGCPFAGVLFVGLMITANGPKVIEYNCRFGDPETQVVLPLYDGDLAELLYNAATGKFTQNSLLPVKKEHAVCVILASGGYPGSYQKGLPVSGLDEVKEATVIHAGTKAENGSIITAGGRVFGVVAKGSTLLEAIAKSYREAGKIRFDGVFCRTDIGTKGLKYYN